MIILKGNLKGMMTLILMFQMITLISINNLGILIIMKEQRKLNKRFHRKEFGTKKELEQQRKRYTSELKVRENKKYRYKEDTKRRKNLELVEQHQENCQRLAKISRERNLKGLKWLQDSFEKVFTEFGVLLLLAVALSAFSPPPFPP